MLGIVRLWDIVVKGYFFCVRQSYSLFRCGVIRTVLGCIGMPSRVLIQPQGLQEEAGGCSFRGQHS